MKVLITGANGYIGSNVVSALLDRGADVIAVDIAHDNVDDRAEHIKANIFGGEENWYTYLGEPDVCLHLAWRNGFVHNADTHMGDLSAHYNFLTNLISHGLKQVAIMGSMHEVGYWEGAIDENTPCKPQSQYGIAKHALRCAMELYAVQHECRFQWLRGFYIFGDDLYGNSIFCKIMQAEREGKKKFPFTTGKNQYDFLHVDELAKQISACVMQSEVLGIINCCSGKPVALADQMEWYIANKHLTIQLDYGKYPDRPYDSPCIYGDNRKIQKIISNLSEEGV